MNVEPGSKDRRQTSARRTDAARAALVGGALLGSLAVAGGLTAQIVAASDPTTSSSNGNGIDPGAGTGNGSGVGTGSGNGNGERSHRTPVLARPSHAPRSHATTQGS